MSVHPSVPPWAHNSKPTDAGLLLSPAGRRYRSIAVRPALSGSGWRMRAVPRCQRTYEAEHQLALAKTLTRQCALLWFLGPTRVYHANCIWIGSSVFVGHRCSHHIDTESGRLYLMLCIRRDLITVWPTFIHATKQAYKVHRIHWNRNSHDDKSVSIDPPRIRVLTLTAAVELWRSGADVKYQSIAPSRFSRITTCDRRG